MLQRIRQRRPTAPRTAPEIVPHAGQWEDAWTNGTAPPPEVHWEMIRAIRSCLDLHGKYVLEVGCGSGYDSAIQAEQGAIVYALDLTPVALDLARTAAQESGVTVHQIVGDTLQLPIASDSVDLVFSQGLVEHFSNPEEVIREQARVVKRGGYLLVDVPQRYSFYTLHKRRLMKRGAWFAGWEREFSLSELTALLRSAGLNPVRSYGTGYFPAVLFGVRNLHTIDRRKFRSARFPRFIGSSAEGVWTALERSPWYYRWMTNIGVIALKPDNT